MSTVEIVIADYDTHLAYVDECDAEVVISFLSRHFFFRDGELCAKPLDALSSLDIDAIKSGLHKYLVNFWTEKVDGVWTLGAASNVSETSIGELTRNGPTSKTAAYVWAHDSAVAVERARRILLDAPDKEGWV